MSVDSAAARVLERLHGLDATLATAESLTGGRLAARLTSVPGASATYLGGVVSYATALKEGLLGVPEELVAEQGVVSAACARAMADGVRRATGASYAVSTTGVAGPELQEGRAVGTVFVGLSGPDGTTCVELRLPGDRAAVQDGACAAALAALAERIAGVVRREDGALG